MLLQMRLEQAEAALVGARGAEEAVLGERCRGDAGNRPPARMQALGPCALLEEDLHAAGRRGGNALRAHERVGVEAEQPPGNQRRAEMRYDAGRVEAHVVEAAFDGSADADRAFHARDEGRQHVGAARALRFRDAEGGRQARHRRVDDGGEMRVVEIEAVQQHAVDEGRIPKRQPLAMPDHRARAVAAERDGARERAFRERIAARRKPNADGIEHQLARPLAHGLGHIRKPHARHELRKPTGGNRRRARPGVRFGIGAIAWRHGSILRTRPSVGGRLTAPLIFVPIVATIRLSPRNTQACRAPAGRTAGREGPGLAPVGLDTDTAAKRKGGRACR